MTDSNEYLSQIKTEKENLDASFRYANRLLSEEIERVEKAGRFTQVHNEKKVKIVEKVQIPIKDYPKFNFVGKLLGPGGSSLKRLQSETGCKMSILGKGSTRDRSKEPELMKGGDPKYAHLSDELHVQVEVIALPMEAHSRVAHALNELRKFLIPTYDDEISQGQFQDMGGERFNGAGDMARGRGGPMLRGRGTPMIGRGAPRGAPRGMPPTRGAPMLRGRGAPRGVMGGPRGAGGLTSPRGVPMRGRGGMPPQRPQPVYEEAAYDTAQPAFDDTPFYEEAATTYDPYAADTSYEASYEPEAYTTESYAESYGDSYGMQQENSFSTGRYATGDAYNNGQSYKAAPPGRTNMRSRPYSVARGGGGGYRS